MEFRSVFGWAATDRKKVTFIIIIINNKTKKICLKKLQLNRFLTDSEKLNIEKLKTPDGRNDCFLGGDFHS